MAKKVLVIDDEAHIRILLQSRLEAQGYEVCCAVNGREGIDKVRTDKPDLVLVDVMMPEMDGFQVCQTLRMDKDYKNMPIVILTASSEADEIKKGMQLGADAYVPKPFKSDMLLGILKGLLGE